MLTLIMKRGSRLSRKPTPSLLSDPKLRTHFQSRNNSLPLLGPEDTMESESETAFTLNRTATIEGVEGQQGSRPGSRQATRALHVGKLRPKVENMGKTGLGTIGRSNSHADISVTQAVPKKAKQGVFSVHPESESVSSLSKSATGLLPRKSHYNSSPQKWSFQPFKHPVRSATPDLRGDLGDLEAVKEALLRAVAGVQPGDLRAKMRVYHVYFGEILKTSGELFEVLEVFQRGYEGLFEDMQEKYTSEVTKLQGEIIHLQSGILREADERKSLLAKIEKLSRENVDLSETCQSYEEKLSDYQEKLYDIANVRMDFYPPSQQAWRVLNSELEYYHGWKRNAEREVKILKAKEKKLVQLMHVLKLKGYPVEEVYRTEVKMSMSSVHSEEVQRDENESQRLVSGRPKSMPKPQTVPSLRLEEVQPDVSSEEVSAEVPSAEMSLGRTLSGLSTHFMTDELSPIKLDSKDRHKAF